MNAAPDDFLTAVRRGDHSTIRSMVDADPALLRFQNDRDFGATPLKMAVGLRDLETVRLLLELGADPDQASDWEIGPFTPLESVPRDCIEFHGESTDRGPIAQALLDAGATLHIHAASHLGRADAIERLLDDDPELIRARGGDGQFPLHYAASPAIASLLLDRGAELEARDLDHDSTAVEWAMPERPEVARFLIERGARALPIVLAGIGDVERLRESPGDLTALFEGDAGRADATGAMSILAFTVGIGTNLLHAATHHGTRALVDFLVDAGVDPNARGGYDDQTPLHAAAWKDNVEVAAALLDRGAEIDAVSGSNHENTPLGWAIVSGGARVVELLLQRGASIPEWARDDAEAGVRGEFRGWSGQPREARLRIRALLSD